MEEKLKQAQAQAAADRVACEEAESTTRGQKIIAENLRTQCTELQRKLADAHAQAMATDESQIKTIVTLEQQVQQMFNDTVRRPLK
jgi:hypothetical protein